MTLRDFDRHFQELLRIPELASIELFDEPFWLAHPRDHELYAKDEITRTDLASIDLLLLADGHCLAQQTMDICQVKEGNLNEDTADLRAASLETLLQLVGAGYGSTLVPALAVRGGWMTDSGIIARQLAFRDAFRRVRIAYRKTFPRQAALEALGDIIRSHLPNTVKVLGDNPPGRKKK